MHYNVDFGALHKLKGALRFVQRTNWHINFSYLYIAKAIDIKINF